MLDAMLSYDPEDDGTDDTQLITQRAEGVLQIARLRIHDQ